MFEIATYLFRRAMKKDTENESCSFQWTIFPVALCEKVKWKMRVSILGSGVVGAATGIGLGRLGNQVVFYDVDQDKLEELRFKGYTVEESISDAVLSTSVSFICVPTPTVKGETDLSLVKNVLASIAEPLRQKKNYHVVALRCTLLPGTTRKVLIPFLNEQCRYSCTEHYGVCYNPEFLRQSSALEDFMNPSRIVIGEQDKQSGNVLEELYVPLRVPIVRTNLDTAETIKHVANAFLATKISFFNEVYMICKKLKIDPQVVSESVALDPRIGKYGVCGGKPFSGSCLPKDAEALTKFVEGLDINPDIMKVVLAINQKLANNKHI